MVILEANTIATDKGTRMDPIKLMNLDMHGIYVKIMKDCLFQNSLCGAE